MIRAEAKDMAKINAIGVVLAIVVAAVISASAQGVNITGKWVFDVQTSQGSGQPTVTFKQDGENLTGHYSSQTLGEADFTGTIKGNAVRFGFKANAQGTEIDVVYEGTVDASGSGMKGAANMAGGQITGSFTGKKQ
jgi:hypothetical protein